MSRWVRKSARLLGLCCVLVLAACAPAAGQPAAKPASSGNQPAQGGTAALSGEYKLGMLNPMTGPMAFGGKLQVEGLEVMRDMVNERGGVMGKRLTFVSADVPDPTAAANEANRLITREGVKIITGTTFSALCGAASEAAARQNVIYWEVSCLDPRFTQRGLKTVYRTEINGDDLGYYMVEFVAGHLAEKLGKRPNELRIAYLSEDSSFGQGTTEAAHKRAREKYSMQEVSLDYYNALTINDFTPIILKLKESRPDVVMALARGNDAILFWKQAKEQDLQFPAMVTGSGTGYGAPDFGAGLTKDANGVFALSEPGEGFRIDGLRPEAQELEREFRRRILERTDTIGSGHLLAGSGLWILKLVLDKAGSDDPEKFRQAALSFDLPVGSLINGWGLKFDETGQNIPERSQHYMLQWQDGKLITVWPEQFTDYRMKWIPLPAWDGRQ
jgi:branched-chain amino acid transport system substrate-binding protein